MEKATIYNPNQYVWADNPNPVEIEHDDTHGYYVEHTFSRPAKMVKIGNINLPTPTRKIDTIKIGQTIISNSSENWTYYNSDQTLTVPQGQEVLIITKDGDWWNIIYRFNTSQNEIPVSTNSWVYINNLNHSPYTLEFKENEQTFIRSRDDSGYDPLFIDFYKSIEFNINWMTFN